MDNLRGEFGQFDVVISQRVLINLLDEEDQRSAIRNVSELVKNDGVLILIECFESSLNNLNEARQEYGFRPIEASYHNMYLKEEMLAEEMQNYEIDCGKNVPPQNFLSTHYYITRVLHDVTLMGKPFIRNSHFVRFFSQALPEAVGDYSPIKLFVYRKVR